MIIQNKTGNLLEEIAYFFIVVQFDNAPRGSSIKI